MEGVNSMNVLIAEDDLDMQKILRLYLDKAGYQTAVASDGREAFDRLCEESFDLVIADWMMPHMNGIDLCKEIRSYSMPVKIIMLTAKGDLEDEIAGLSCGADDYIRKPFHPQLLLLRIQKLFQIEDGLHCGELTLNSTAQSAFVGREEIRLTQKEFLLLQTLLLNKGITLSRELLLNRVWGNDYDGDERTLDTHIRRLRNKIGKPYITTFIGIGYRLEEPHE